MIDDPALVAKLDTLPLRDPGNLRTVFAGTVLGMELIGADDHPRVYYAVVRIERMHPRRRKKRV